MHATTLHETLRELHANAMIRQAETIRDWPVQPERHEQAVTHVRLALWEQQMGRITDEVLQRIYSALSFVMPDDGAFVDDTIPLESLEREAEWEQAYYEQLARQRCDGCGDGACSVDSE